MIVKLQLAPTSEAYSVRRQLHSSLSLLDAMIEQPRLAAIGIMIMTFGVLWMGLPYLWGNSDRAEDGDTPDEAMTESTSAAEPTVGTPTGADDCGTDTEATASLGEEGAVDNDQSPKADNSAAGDELPAASGDRDPPDESTSTSENNS